MTSKRPCYPASTPSHEPRLVLALPATRPPTRPFWPQRPTPRHPGRNRTGRRHSIAVGRAPDRAGNPGPPGGLPKGVIALAALAALAVGLLLILAGRPARQRSNLGKGRTTALGNRTLSSVRYGSAAGPTGSSRAASPRNGSPPGGSTTRTEPRWASTSSCSRRRRASGRPTGSSSRGTGPAPDREHRRAQGLGAGRCRPDPGGTAAGGRNHPGESPACEVPVMRAEGELRAGEG